MVLLLQDKCMNALIFGINTSCTRILHSVVELRIQVYKYLCVNSIFTMYMYQFYNKLY